MVVAVINYATRTDFRPRYFANDHSRDTVLIDPRPMQLLDGRTVSSTPDREGFQLVSHVSAVEDFTDEAAVAAVHPQEIVALLLAQTGADEVIVTAPGILRFSERSQLAGKLNNSMPARFAHIDATSQTSATFAANSLPEGRAWRRYAHYNVWRSFSGAPQDVPLAVCDAQSVTGADLIEADAIFDQPGRDDWDFSSSIIAHNQQHRWHWFADMTRDEALIFKTSDSEYQNPVPHVAFDNPLTPPDCHPRASIEMRAVAYWYT
ncbi:MAG: CmcJ/NvfI family oxidoreductase [Sphingorhabdus sp.]